MRCHFFVILIFIFQSVKSTEPNLNYTALDYTGGDAPSKIIEIINSSSSTSFIVIQRNNFNFILINQFIVGATFISNIHEDEEDLSDELAFQAWPLQAAALYAACKSFTPTCKAPQGPTREAVIVPCQRPMKALLLGCGAGSIAGYLSRRKVTVDVVEYHSEIIDLAQRYGGLSNNGGGKIIIGDALSTLQKGRMKIKRTRYNIIIHDLFDGSKKGVNLYHYDTFVLLKRQWLMPKGILVINLLGSHVADQPTYPLLQYIVQSLRLLFATVRCYREIPLDIHPKQILNVACYATNDPRGITFTLPDTVAYAPGDEYPTSFGIRSFQQWEVMMEEKREEEKTEKECIVVVDGAEGTCLTYRSSGIVASSQSQSLSPPPPLSFEIWEKIANDIHVAMEAHAVELLGGKTMKELVEEYRRYEIELIV